ncbi:MAG: hypothetical protein NVSMB32_00740 [Actinomycetota bacterium]
MAETGRAIMLGIRHRCGQEIQFWIPAELVEAIAQRLDEQTETLGLAEWMRDEGILHPADDLPPEALVERLRTELAPRDIHLIHVDQDESSCPSCGALLRWLDILVDYARGNQGEAQS